MVKTEGHLPTIAGENLSTVWCVDGDSERRGCVPSISCRQADPRKFTLAARSTGSRRKRKNYFGVVRIGENDLEFPWIFCFIEVKCGEVEDTDRTAKFDFVSSTQCLTVWNVRVNDVDINWGIAHFWSEHNIACAEEPRHLEVGCVRCVALNRFINRFVIDFEICLKRKVGFKVQSLHTENMCDWDTDWEIER